MRKAKDIREWCQISLIKDGLVKVRKNEFCKILEITPINFSLKSVSEQEGILYQYKAVLKSCDFDFQILIYSKKYDSRKYADYLEKAKTKEKDDKVRLLIDEYIKEVEINNNGGICRKFFIVFKTDGSNLEEALAKVKERTLKIQNTLIKCGNDVRELSDFEATRVLYEFFNKKTSEVQVLKEDAKEWITLPSDLNFSNPNYSLVDGVYSAGVIVVNYVRMQEIGWILPLFNLDFNVDISIFYEKLNSAKVIRDLTYHIGNINGAIKTVSSNQEDIDLMEMSFEDAKYIRKELQVNKEDLYQLCTYVSVFDSDLNKLTFNLERLEGVCAAMGLQTRRANFRQEYILKAMLPICENSKDIKKSATRNVLTEGLISTYPFVSSELSDENGVVVGNNCHNNSLIVIDRFCDKKYKNANMTILGTSGAGKSFMTKVMILRNRYMGIKQLVIDPEKEYGGVCEALDGTLVTIGNGDTFINVMDIRENVFLEEGEKVGYLADKLRKLKIFYGLIFDNLTLEEEALLEEYTTRCYFEKGITHDDDSLYELEDGKIRLSKRFKSNDKMPILGDLYEMILVEEKLKRVALQMKSFIDGSNSFFNGHTNVELKNKLIVAEISGLDENLLPAGMYLVTELFWDLIKQNRKEKKIIYLDEVWRLIGSSGNKETAEFVFKLFKTVRKYGCGATAITQDVVDFFSMEDGKYGRAIVNNSALKFVFQLEEEDVKLLKDILTLSTEEELRIKGFERGNGLFFAGKNHVATKVIATKQEEEIIVG